MVSNVKSITIAVASIEYRLTGTGFDPDKASAVGFENSLVDMGCSSLLEFCKAKLACPLILPNSEQQERRYENQQNRMNNNNAM
jgi:hypothetical protein